MPNAHLPSRVKGHGKRVGGKGRGALKGTYVCTQIGGRHRPTREFRFISLMHFARVRGQSYGNVGVTSDRGACIERRGREGDGEVDKLTTYLH